MNKDRGHQDKTHRAQAFAWRLEQVKGSISTSAIDSKGYLACLDTQRAQKTRLVSSTEKYLGTTSTPALTNFNITVDVCIFCLSVAADYHCTSTQSMNQST